MSRSSPDDQSTTRGDVDAVAAPRKRLIHRRKGLRGDAITKFHVVILQIPIVRPRLLKEVVSGISFISLGMQKITVLSIQSVKLRHRDILAFNDLCVGHKVVVFHTILEGPIWRAVHTFIVHFVPEFFEQLVAFAKLCDFRTIFGGRETPALFLVEGALQVWGARRPNFPPDHIVELPTRSSVLTPLQKNSILMLTVVVESRRPPLEWGNLLRRARRRRHGFCVSITKNHTQLH